MNQHGSWERLLTLERIILKSENTFIAVGHTLSTGHPVSQTAYTYKNTHTHTIRFSGKRIKYYKTSHALWNTPRAAAFTLSSGDLECLRGPSVEVSPPVLFTRQCRGNEWYDGRRGEERDSPPPIDGGRLKQKEVGVGGGTIWLSPGKSYHRVVGGGGFPPEQKIGMNMLEVGGALGD